MDFMPQRNPGRSPKPFRYVVVVQDNELALDPKWEVLLVCPIHSDHNYLTSWDFELPAPPIPGVPRLDAQSWVLIPSIQPVLKDDIEAQMGALPVAVMAEIYRRLVAYTGLGDFSKQFGPAGP